MELVRLVCCGYGILIFLFMLLLTNMVSWIRIKVMHISFWFYAYSTIKMIKRKILVNIRSKLYLYMTTMLKLSRCNWMYRNMFVICTFKKTNINNLDIFLAVHTLNNKTSHTCIVYPIFKNRRKIHKRSGRMSDHIVANRCL